MEAMRIATWLVIVMTLCLIDVAMTQTTCSLNFPASDLSACDAVGALETNVNAEVYETRGSVRSLSENQDGAYKILSQQVTRITEQATTADADLLDITGEIQTLKTFLANLQAIQADVETGGDDVSREKRAAPPPSTQQLLNTAKAAFQQAIVNVGGKLQNLTRSLTSHIQQTTSLHAAIQGSLSKNIVDLSTAYTQVQTLDKDVQAARASLTTGGGVSLTNVTQEVFQLTVDSRTVEAVTQRQLDGMDTQLQQLGVQDASIDQDIKNTILVTRYQMPRVNNTSNDVDVLRSAARIYEDRIGDFITNSTRDLAAAQTEIDKAQNQTTKLKRDYFDAVQIETGLRSDITAIRPNIDGIQTLVTYNKGISASQSGDILRMKKTVSDDLAALKYVFGLTNKMP